MRTAPGGDAATFAVGTEAYIPRPGQGVQFRLPGLALDVEPAKAAAIARVEAQDQGQGATRLIACATGAWARQRGWGSARTDHPLPKMRTGGRAEDRRLLLVTLLR